MPIALPEIGLRQAPAESLAARSLCPSAYWNSASVSGGRCFRFAARPCGQSQGGLAARRPRTRKVRVAHRSRVPASRALGYPDSGLPRHGLSGRAGVSPGLFADPRQPAARFAGSAWPLRGGSPALPRSVRRRHSLRRTSLRVTGALRRPFLSRPGEHVQAIRCRLPYPLQPAGSDPQPAAVSTSAANPRSRRPSPPWFPLWTPPPRRPLRQRNPQRGNPSAMSDMDWGGRRSPTDPGRGW